MSFSSDKIQPLSVSSNSITTYNDWLSWKRAITYYLEAKDISEPARKKAVVLHKGGKDLQEIFATIEAADPKAKEAKDVFVYLIDNLDKHFKPTTNKCYERFLFRQIRQGSESIEQFVVRLRKQAANCKFSSIEEAICDQIIDGTANPHFRQKILEQRLDKIQPIVELGKLLEAVQVQTKSMAGEANEIPQPLADSVARVTVKDREVGDRLPRKAFPMPRNRCFRCGSFRHTGQDADCPALDGSCYRCGKKGHFANRCRAPLSSSAEPSNARQYSSSSSSASFSAPRRGRDAQKVRTLENKSSQSSSDEGNAFHLSKEFPDQAPSNKVPLKFAGIELSPIVDSGADVNLIDPPTWRYLRRCGIRFSNSSIDTKVYPYGRKAPLQFQKAVTFVVQSRSQSILAKFFVLAEDQGDYETLVGRRLATMLGILRIGDGVNAAPSVRHLCVKGVDRKGLGKLIGVQISVPLDCSISPVAQPCRRVPFALRKKIRNHTNELLCDDVIEEVTDEPTSWVSPIVPVIKKNGDLRLCIDMRLANKAVLREKYPIPTFEELVADMTDCEIFSRIDLRSAYHQIELSPDSRKINTFVTPDGIFRFKRLYCGIKCAPEIFQRLMTEVLKGLDNVKVFFDDIIVFSKSKPDHEKHVNAVLDRLSQRGLTINLEKSTFGVSEINFLGHKLSKNCIRPNESNADAIKNFSPPQNKKDLQSFLGLMNYVARFIPNYSSISEPLRQLIRKNVVFRWSPRHQEVFDRLKGAIVGVELGMLDQSATIQIFADASPVGLGAVLLQQRAGKSTPEILGFASRSLSLAEQNYSQIEGEALGLVWACERFRMYTLGKRFELFTDHKPLEILFGPKSKPNARIERWVLRLQNFDYLIKYIQGPSNIADPFSRLGCTTPNKRSYADSVKSTIYQLAAAAVPKAISLEEFQRESEADKEISDVRSAIESGEAPPSLFMRVKWELSTVNNMVLRGDRLVPPFSLRKKILILAHEGHPGIEVMKKRLRTKVWWPGIDKEAELFVKSCRSCLAVSSFNPPEPMQRSPLPSGPWDYLAIDFMGPLPDGRYILAVVDYFSRFLECVFTESTSSSTTIRCLYQIFARFGVPSRLKSDNAKSFTSSSFKNFLAEYGIEHVTSPPLWPQANGEIERQNRSILKRLQIASIERKDLVIELSKYLLLYHNTPHSTTHKSPAELMFHRHLKDKLPSISSPSPFFDEVQDVDALEKNRGRDYADKKRRAAPRDLRVGDMVLLPAPRSDKLSPAFDPEPFTVVESSPGEVVVRRGNRSFRRSAAMVKPVPREFSDSPLLSQELPVPSVPEPNLLGGFQSPSTSVAMSCAPPPVAPTSSLSSQGSCAPASAAPTTSCLPHHGLPITRFGRTVKPPRRLDL